MTEVRWTLQAADDLAAIRDFIARDSPGQAQAVVERLFDSASQLATFPDSGRMVPERGTPELRELVRPPYRLVYRRRPEVVEILTVHHAALPIPESLPGEEGTA